MKLLICLLMTLTILAATSDACATSTSTDGGALETDMPCLEVDGDDAPPRVYLRAKCDA